MPYPLSDLAIVSDGVTTHGRLHLLNIEVVTADLPDVLYDLILDVPSSQIHQILRQANEHGDNVQFMAKYDEKHDQQLLFIVSEGDLSSSTTCLGVKGDHISVDKRDMYRLKTLLLCFKASSLSPFVTLKMKKEFALVVVWQVGTLGQVEFIIAPRIEESTKSLSNIDMEAMQIYTKDVTDDGEPSRKKRKKDDILAHVPIKKK